MPAQSQERIVQAGPLDYVAAVARLRPGDRLQLSPGRYEKGLVLHGMQGLPQAPIVIEGAADGGTVFLARAGRNTVSIKDAAYLVVRRLSLQGDHLDADAVKCEGRARFAHHIVLEQLRIRDHDGNQSTVGISTKCPAWNWTIRDNLIVGVGTGLYLGDSDGTAPFVAGTIVGNRISRSLGYNLQIKHQVARPPLAAMPMQPQTTRIAGNAFAKSENSSTGHWARPNVLLGAFPDSGPGSQDRYLVEGNLFDGNPSEALFQAEGHVVFRDNRAFNPHGDGILLQPHRGQVKRAVVEGNTVAAFGHALQISPEVDPARVTLRNNLIYGVASFAGLDAAVNVMRPYEPDTVERLRGAQGGAGTRPGSPAD
jgi:hypothetical protein